MARRSALDRGGKVLRSAGYKILNNAAFLARYGLPRDQVYECLTHDTEASRKTLKEAKDRRSIAKQQEQKLVLETAGYEVRSKKDSLRMYGKTAKSIFNDLKKGASHPIKPRNAGQISKKKKRPKKKRPSQGREEEVAPDDDLKREHCLHVCIKVSGHPLLEVGMAEPEVALIPHDRYERAMLGWLIWDTFEKKRAEGKQSIGRRDDELQSDENGTKSPIYQLHCLPNEDTPSEFVMRESFAHWWTNNFLQKQDQDKEEGTWMAISFHWDMSDGGLERNGFEMFGGMLDWPGEGGEEPASATGRAITTSHSSMPRVSEEATRRLVREGLPNASSSVFQESGDSTFSLRCVVQSEQYDFGKASTLAYREGSISSATENDW